MKENPDIKVEIQAIASGDIYTKLAAMATSPDDLPTMFFTSADQVPTLYDLGLTEDLNNWMDKDCLLYTSFWQTWDTGVRLWDSLPVLRAGR